MVGSTSRPSSPSCGEPAGCGGLDSSRLAHNQQHELDRFAQLNDGSFLDRDGQLFWRDDKPKEVKLGKKTLSPVTFGVEPLSGLNNVVSFDGYWIWRRPSLKSKDGPHDSALLCAAKKDGSLWCLGRNESGQLGDGTQTSRLEAKRVEGLENVVQIQLNGHFACARTAGDEVYCWGENRVGRVKPYGDPAGFYSFYTRPVRVAPELHDIVDLLVGEGHSCAARKDGAAICWGGVEPKRIGWFPPKSCEEATIAQTEPLVFDVPECRSSKQLFEAIPPNPSDPVVRVLATRKSSCALRRSGILECWGGYWGAPKQLPGLESEHFRDFGADLSSENVCAVTTDGRVFCWGEARSGKIGDGSRHSEDDGYADFAERPQQVLRIDDAKSVMCGVGHCCATSEGGQVQCWGRLRFADVGWVEEICGGPFEVLEPVEPF